MKIPSFKLLLLIAGVVVLAAAEAVCAQSTDDETAPMAGLEPSPGAIEDDESGGDVFDFRLVGIAVSGNPAQSLAVIEGRRDGRQRFCHEGDLVGGLGIRKILRDRLIVAGAAGERALPLNRSYSDSSSPDGTLMSQPPVSDPQPPLLKNQIVEVKSEKLSSSLADINKVLERVNLNPVLVYGQPIGVRISPIEPGSIFAELGLKTGDIIRAVNGEEIRKPEEAISFLERIREGGEFDINIKGSRHSRKFQLIVR